MDIDRFIDFTRNQNPLRPDQVLACPKEELECRDAVPGWLIGSDLFCWCEEHFRWNQHGYTGRPIEFRANHHPLQERRHEGSLAIVVQGEAPKSIREVLRYYLQSPKKRHTPPPYPMVRVIRAA